MESIENKVKAILNGEIDENEEKEFLNIDYTLEQQNYELTARGIDPKVSSEFRPKIGLNVTYVVTAVIFNDKNEVLMMQEAKSQCAGSWYLPAGRVEPMERFEDAIKKGVSKETGLIFQPHTILKVESSHGNWFRFVYTGTIIGGQLKTSSKADQESLQATYVSDASKLDLRSQDCLKLIELGREYQSNRNQWHNPQLTINRLVPTLLLRLLIVVRNKENSKYHFLVSNSLVSHLPICEINPTRSLHSSLKRFMQRIFGLNDLIVGSSSASSTLQHQHHQNQQKTLPQHKPFGLLTIEHDCARQSDQFDGLCLTMLVVCKDSDECLQQTNQGFSWIQLNSNSIIVELLTKKFSSKYKTILHSVL